MSVFSADATVFLAIPNSRNSGLREPLDLYSRRISAQFSNVITPQGVLGVLNFHPSTTAQLSRVVDSYPERFVQEQVGHAYASTTAIYASVSNDFKDKDAHVALARVYAPTDQEDQ